MPIHFVWQPNNSPVTTAHPNRVSIGLEFGGEDATLGAATPGTVKLFEAGGSGNTAGREESSERRLLATFHGTFHRTPSGPVPKRVTFELEVGNSPPESHDGDVLGFDPECMVGVDALVLTFVNREFLVYFPFFVDTRSEGQFLEIVAVAEIEGKDAPVESAVLNLRIRRNHAVETTTRNPSGSGFMKYTGRVIGNIILHHEDYLVDAASWNANAEPPSNLTAQLTPVYAGGPNPIPFAPYTSGSLRIILMTQILDSLCPSDQDLAANLKDSRIPRQSAAALRTKISGRVRQSLVDIFVDGGFAGAQAFWSDNAAVATEVSAFKNTFSQSTSDCAMRPGRTPLRVPFWTFFVAYSSSLPEGVVGVGEGFEFDNATNMFHAGSKQYLLPCPAPIGSGNKALRSPARIHSDYFMNKLLNPQLPPKSRGRGGAKSSAPAFNYNQTVDTVCAKLAITLAHEVGHRLGLMHDMFIRNSGPYDEASASPLMSMMASSIESDSFGVETRFSNQAKVIWATAFGVSPNWTVTYLKNKTWGSDWQTTEWSERRRRLFEQNQEEEMTRPAFTTIGSTPPFAGTGSKVQRGTYIAKP